MMRLEYDKAAAVAWWNARMDQVALEKTQSAICVVDPNTNQIIAVALFHNFKGHDIEIGFAADDPRWAERGVIRAIFHYVFEQLGCSRLTTITAKNNKRARKLDEGLGFKLEGVHENGMAPGVTAISYGMTKENCKWLG